MKRPSRRRPHDRDLALRCSTAMRIVVPMMMMATTANAAPTTIPRQRRAHAPVELLDPVATEADVVMKAKPVARLATRSHGARASPGIRLELHFDRAGNGLRSSSSSRRAARSSSRGRGQRVVSETRRGLHLRERSDVLECLGGPSIGSACSNRPRPRTRFDTAQCVLEVTTTSPNNPRTTVRRRSGHRRTESSGARA